MSPLMFIMLLSFLPFPILAMAMLAERRMQPARKTKS